MKGIQWFTGYLLFEKGKLHTKGVPVLNETGRQVAAINAELKKLGPILINLNSINVFHTPPIPRGCKQTTPDHWVQPIGKELVLGTFRDDNKKDYLIIANKDVKHKQKTILQFQLFQRIIDSVEIFDKKTGEWKALKVKKREDTRDHDFIYNLNNVPESIKNYITYNHKKLDPETLAFFELYHTYRPPYDYVEFTIAPGDGELIRVSIGLGENIPDPRR